MLVGSLQGGRKQPYVCPQCGRKMSWNISTPTPNKGAGKRTRLSLSAVNQFWAWLGETRGRFKSLLTERHDGFETFGVMMHEYGSYDA